MKKNKGKPRAPDGASQVSMLVRMERTLKRDVENAADRAEPPVNANEWVREAIRRRLKEGE